MDDAISKNLVFPLMAALVLLAGRFVYNAVAALQPHSSATLATFDMLVMLFVVRPLQFFVSPKWPWAYDGATAVKSTRRTLAIGATALTMVVALATVVLVGVRFYYF
jgi:hypothetical protein